MCGLILYTYVKSTVIFANDFTPHRLDVAVSLRRMADLTKDEVKWAFDLMKECVEELYVLFTPFVEH